MSGKGFYGDAEGDTGFRRKFTLDDVRKRKTGEIVAGDEAIDVVEGQSASKSAKPTTTTTTTTSTTSNAYVPAIKMDGTYDFEANLNKVQMVHLSTTGDRSAQPGYYCRVCDCVFKDNASFLTHETTREHQRNIGMSLNVRRATVEEVRERLQMLRERRDAQKQEFDFDKHVAFLKEMEDREKAEHKERKREAKAAKRRKQQQEEAENVVIVSSSFADDGEDGDDGNVVEVDVAAMLGFTGFGSSKK